MLIIKVYFNCKKSVYIYKNKVIKSVMRYIMNRIAILTVDFPIIIETKYGQSAYELHHTKAREV